MVCAPSLDWTGQGQARVRAERSNLPINFMHLTIMADVIRLLIVDAHAVVRKGLAMVLRLEADAEHIQTNRTNPVYSTWLAAFTACKIFW